MDQVLLAAHLSRIIVALSDLRRCMVAQIFACEQEGVALDTAELVPVDGGACEPGLTCGLFGHLMVVQVLSVLTLIRVYALGLKHQSVHVGFALAFEPRSIV